MTDKNFFYPKVFIWARETAGYTQSEAAVRLQIKDAYGKTALQRLNEIETGTSQPSNKIICRMAKLYHRPEAVFYLDFVPEESGYGADFRKFKPGVTKIEKGLSDAVVRNILARQSIVKDTLIELREAETLTFLDSSSVENSVYDIAKSIKQTLKFDLESYRKPKQPQGAFSYLRKLVESLGVYVILIDNLGSHHTRVPPKVFRGFSIADEHAPFIAVNCNDSPRAWSFTLLHELTHLWIGNAGLCNENTSHKVEELCDQVASDILLPDSEFRSLEWGNIDRFEGQMSKITDYADTFNVSRTMIAYRLMKAKIITRNCLAKIIATVNHSIQNKKQEIHKHKGGPSYYNVKAHRSGTSLVEFTERMLAEREITLNNASLLLGVRPKNVHKLLQTQR